MFATRFSTQSFVFVIIALQVVPLTRGTAGLFFSLISLPVFLATSYNMVITRGVLARICDGAVKIRIGSLWLPIGKWVTFGPVDEIEIAAVRDDDVDGFYRCDTSYVIMRREEYRPSASVRLLEADPV